jgi:TonB family protein
MNGRLLLSVAALALLGVVDLGASDVKVIANPSIGTDTISAAELRGVFQLQRKKLKDGSSVEPVLQKEGAVHSAFLKTFLGRDSEEMHIYYQGVVFTGKASMPKELSSDSEVIEYVAKTRGAIGYVSATANTAAVKVLTVAPVKSTGERILLRRVEPEYPKELHQRGIKGTVRLALAISPKGSVQSVRVVGGNPILAEAAVKAVEQWVYSPSAATSILEVSILFEVRP